MSGITDSVIGAWSYGYLTATYSSNNQISSLTTTSSTTTTSLIVTYDAAGNMTSDGYNSYTYDAEGRVCALNGPTGPIGYQYDADGNRIGKGTVTNWQSCDITTNGYTPTTDFVLDQGGGQMTEVAVGGGYSVWQHTNVTANGTLIATYDTTGLHFYLNDALGSRRVQADPSGNTEQFCQSLPYGDQLYCSGSLTSPTEHHFTGKERDTESGLDYFGARYFGSNTGRFQTPDWAEIPRTVPYGIFSDPQSLNLYSYGRNNPTSITDADGHGFSFSEPDPKDIPIPDFSFPDPPTRQHARYMITNGTNPTTPDPAPSNSDPSTQRQQQCMNSFYNSRLGKLIDFGSIGGLVPGWSPNWKANLKEIGKLGTAKFVGLKGMAAITARTDTLTLTTLFSSTTIASSVSAGLTAGIHFIGTAGLIGSGIATVADIEAHFACLAKSDPGMASSMVNAMQ